MSSASDTAEPVLGGKAEALLKLEKAGFLIPASRFSPVDIPAAVSELGFPLVVRSSATVEDGRSSSFAGQFESFLNLNSLEEVREAVEKCHESVLAPSVVEYCKKNGVDPGDVQMGVILQRMIRPELAGVAFTINPVTGKDEVVIEAVEGLADALLAGRQEALPGTHPLVQKYRPEIEKVARRVQLHFGEPQDLEFAIEGGELHLLQARPITRIGFAPGVGEWTNADFRDGGVSSAVCTPLMWSLYDWIWEDAIKGWLRDMKLLKGDFLAGQMFFGRPYWNLGAVKNCFAKIPGFVEREFDTDLSVEIQYEGTGLHTPVNFWTILKAIPTGLAIPKFFRKQEAFNEKFLAGGFDDLVRKYEDIPEDVDAAFKTLVEEDYKLFETNYFRTIFAASVAKLDFNDAFPETDYTALVAALPEMTHLAPTRALRAMAKSGETDIAPLLREFRHHSRRELDIRVPRWEDDRGFVAELLEQYRKGTVESDPRPAYEKARAAAVAAVPEKKRKSFHKKLDKLRRFVWLREEMRDLSSKMYYHIRRYVVEIAKRRGLGDDIFFMTWQEIIADDRTGIENGRETCERFRNFAAPNEIGSRFTFAPASHSDGELKGIGASQGRTEGTARVARTVEEAACVEKGAILVCPFTDPGWTPVLDRVSGVVTETGGLLSHAAVICREYGIPAVLGVPGATSRIPDGQKVVVDGGTGRVELVGEEKK